MRKIDWEDRDFSAQELYRIIFIMEYFGENALFFFEISNLYALQSRAKKDENLTHF
jgi:hypothetical protein